MSKVFKDDGRSLRSFSNHILVICPKCEAGAHIRLINYGKEAKLICESCGCNKVSSIRHLSSNENRIDSYFHLPYLLQVPCCGKVLWAYNQEHLAYISSYITATQRIGLSEEEADKLGIRNRTAASRMPNWMIQAKNRDEVLKGVQRLQKMLVG